MIENAGHSPHIERQAAVLDALTDHLA